MKNSSQINHYQLVPAIFQALSASHQEISKTLEPKLRHLIELRASQINRCAFCVKMHTEEAKKDGETAERIERIMVWDHVDDFSEKEQAALAWTEALTELDAKTDYNGLRSRLKQHFEDQEISAMTAAVAMINLWNRVQVSNH
ncbi:carboxymuconolactone decarboxylase family protein [Roseibium denhamense]|uniref:Alkylhydroperoxidase AhpD family core domain-containing protein n=1 Tax=Roseibium denhamense TaxID=76305 RepID=A0ABY1PDN1_9HYPH|nr:carboxymuconolactone decarboxylase family protein [Roseibium denhamense]MTI04579.1 carboxymuconolactone decarboxylase family protein [Roseibium denhamense]SMP31171.1 alkylhydroperoxidase AhpD family core domain-containing protein [Roseibium denhamense]